MTKDLEYLSDVRVITPQQLSSILAQVPTEIPSNSASPSPLPSPVPTNVKPAATAQLANPPFNEKKPTKFALSLARALPPPAYVAAPAAPTVALASALYEYNPSDTGDLAILPTDRIFITEFMNADWAKGRNQRTGLDGIFPRSYVTIVEEDNTHSAPPQPTTSNYGNLPLDISQSGGGTTAYGGNESKLTKGSKRFGKKLGNASQLPRYLRTFICCRSSLLTFFPAIFGAGATIGSNIVNGIF